MLFAFVSGWQLDCLLYFVHMFMFLISPSLYFRRMFLDFVRMCLFGFLFCVFGLFMVLILGLLYFVSCAWSVMFGFCWTRF